MKGSDDSTDPLDVPRRGIPFVIVGVLVFSLQDVVIKWISGSYPVYEIVFVRSLVAILPLLLIVQFEGGFASLRTRQSSLQLVRAGAMFMAYTCFYLAIAALPLADVVALTFVSPLFVTAFSVPLLGEKVGARRWLAVTIGFIGVLVMLRPGARMFDPVAPLAVLAAFTYAFAAVITRRLGQTDSGSSMAFYPTAFYLAASAIVGLAIGDGTFARGGTPSCTSCCARGPFQPGQIWA